MADDWHDGGPATLGQSHRFTYESVAAGVGLEVSVALPAFYEAVTDPRPVVYVLDGDLTFAMAAPIARAYELLALGRFPSLVVVGIGYAGNDLFEVMSRRMLDLSTTASPGTSATSAAATAAARHGFGGAPAFLDALRDEIIPEVERRFRVDPTDRTLAGWSLGGLFGLHVLFSEPELFRRYLLVSPSIWWDGGDILEREAEWSSRHDDLRAELFLAVGDREETSVTRSWPEMPADLAAEAQMVSNVHRFGERLRSRGYRSLQVSTAVLDEEHHTSVFPAAFGLGLRRLHAGVR
ncbi:MAG TPA: alpha/beta hydrolase-fold protein [Acidimicrobiales bacterium]|nr:alpha/beta hydrolase-fold protein [Acidimicrobiales bacterium]